MTIHKRVERRGQPSVANMPMPDSPVEVRRKELPRGNGKWPGYVSVYHKIAAACEVIARTPYVYLSDEHVNAMAVLGSGHEETMKYELMRLRMRGFVQDLETESQLGL